MKQLVTPPPNASAGSRSQVSGIRLKSLTEALAPPVTAIVLAFVVASIPIALSGKNPVLAYWALLRGAVGSPAAVAFALNKSTPYFLAGVGVALCFRAKIVNIGSEGQIAVGGIASAWTALHLPQLPAVLLVPAALGSAAVAGAALAGVAAVIRLRRGVHEVLSTLMLNFVGTLLVSEVLHGPMGEVGAGFPQSPLLPSSSWLPALFPGINLHAGIVIAIFVALGGHLLLWHTPFGFRLRLLGSSSAAAAYAGVSFGRCLLQVMALAGGLAGIAGGIEVLGVHYRLMQGFSQGYGFNAVAIALLAGLNPIFVLPAGLFFGFLESGALAMQREIGVPSSLVYVIQGLTIIFVLCAMGIGASRRRV